MSDKEADRISRLVSEYSAVHRYETANGYIIWRRGTGENVELLHLRTDKPRQGTGTTLLRCMLNALQFDPPYHSVFGFTRTNNKAAKCFYLKHGFALTIVEGVYADGQAILFSQSYKTLTDTFGITTP